VYGYFFYLIIITGEMQDCLKDLARVVATGAIASIVFA
jgi:hypothetical protein